MNNAITQKYIMIFKQNVFSKENAGLKMKKIQVWMALVAIGGIVVYLALINSMATQGYEMRKLESQKNELGKVNQELRVATANAQSGEVIRQKVQNLDLRQVVNVSYIDKAGTVAYNR